ncbi:heavy metal-binding domain-containing protein [Streptomyces sp. NPDC012794]|uniref:heavy metal-binding domain-containing protein n=1 Tax=Streptomyces sp. NPDC012794 TaxID=3364850 RepID=UPI00368736F6
MTYQQPDGTWDSTLSAREFAAVTGVGFEPVGQVMGTAVFHLGDTGAWGCPGAWTAAGGPSGPSSPSSPSLAPLTRAVSAARRLALSRAVAECRALGGDGIVAVRLVSREHRGEATEFTVIGTAVRARSRVRPRQPFTSHLGGQDLARLLHGGWVPTGLAFGVSLAIRHDDWRASRLAGRRFVGNQEVDGYTRLTDHVRQDARARLALDARKHGGGAGDGVVVDEVGLRLRRTECLGSEGGSARDVIAEAVFVGTSITRFGRSRRPAAAGPPTIMRLEREH